MINKLKIFSLLFVLAITCTASATINVTLNSPINEEYYSTQPIHLAVATSPVFDTCWWTVDSGITNTSFTSSPTTISGLSFGTKYNLTTYCNESLGYNGSDSATFYYASTITNGGRVAVVFGIMMVVCIVLTSLWYHSNNPFYSFLAGAVCLLLGIYLIINGFPEVNNDLLEKGLGVIFTGIGMYAVVVSPLELVKQGAGE